MKTTKTFDLKTLDTLSLKELRAIHNVVFAAVNRAERIEATKKLSSRLISVDVEPRDEVSVTDRKRFASGFYRERRGFGGLGGRLYGETKTGILYVRSTSGKSWKKVT